jgi:iron complex outermembrane recepter protein
LTNVQPLRGKFDVKELFGELNVPVLPDDSPVGSLSFNGAVRYTDYNLSGSVTTWKAGAVWKPVPAITVRGTVSRDIRAPNLGELFRGSVQTQTTVNDTINKKPGVGVLVSQIGNAALQPEIAKTYTAGIVFTGLRGLVVSADYFSIKVNDVISTLTAQQTIDACAASSASPQCADLVYSDPAKTSLIRVFTPNLNLSELKTSGIDGELSYSTALPGNAGSIQFRALGSYLIEYKKGIPGGTILDYAGVVGSLNNNNPTFAGTASIDYNKNGFSFHVQERLIGASKFQAATEQYSPALADNKVPAVWYTDLTITQHVAPRFEMFATVNNLFNRFPPILPVGLFAVTYPTNSTLYDVAGRMITVGARVKF